MARRGGGSERRWQVRLQDARINNRKCKDESTQIKAGRGFHIVGVAANRQRRLGQSVPTPERGVACLTWGRGRIKADPSSAFDGGVLGYQSAKPHCGVARTHGGRANRLTAILTSAFRDRNYSPACQNLRSITSSQQLGSPWRAFTKLPDNSLGRVNMTSDNWRLQNLLISMMYRSDHLRADPGGNL